MHLLSAVHLCPWPRCRDSQPVRVAWATATVDVVFGCTLFLFFFFFFFFLFLLRNYSLLLAGSRRVLTMTMLTSVGQSVGRSVDEESTGWVSRQSWEQPRPTRGGNGEHRTAQKRSTQ